ncbi:MAG: hypothetical protein RL308_896 [Bacteroidota bacterium]|jgi:hypothetical protein
MEHEKLNTEETANSDLGAVSGSIIANLEARVYNLSLKYPEMKVGEFKNIKEVKDIMTAIAVLEKYYR